MAATMPSTSSAALASALRSALSLPFPDSPPAKLLICPVRNRSARPSFLTTLRKYRSRP